jgi:hypothetical protein
LQLALDAAGPQSSWSDSGEAGGIILIKRDNISGLELMFLSLTAAGVISIIVAGLQVVFRFVG